MIYLDENASAPLRPEAWQAMQPWLSGPAGNPASAHAAGRRARRALEDARELLAALLDAAPDEVVFTSGATEANNLAIFGLAGDPPGRLVTSRIEHPCVIEPFEVLSRRGFQVNWLPVAPDGTITPDVLAGAIETPVQLIAIMLANHETGALLPIIQLRNVASGIDFHCDAAQAVGKIGVRFHELGVTTLSLSGHKFGGPPGIGALLVSRCARLRPLLFGGHQQQGRRPGTEPVALAVGLSAALAAAEQQRESAAKCLSGLRQRLLSSLRAEASPVIVNGPEDAGLPHVLNVSFPGCRSDALLMAFDLAGVCCSTGSACSSGSLLPSPVLKAMSLTDDRLLSAMRFSLGPTVSAADVDEAARRVVRVVNRLRQTTFAEA